MTLLESKIRAFLKDYEDVVIREKDGKYYYDLYCDIDDELSNDQINEILISDNPIETLYRKIREAYYQSLYEVELNLAADFRRSKYGYTEKIDDAFDWFYNNIILDYPKLAEHFFKQKVCTNIFLDTGDKANGYEDNDIYPSGYGRYDELYDISDKSSVLWLANQQGYSKDDFLDVFETRCRNTESGLLYDLYQELLNSYNGGCIAVLTEMTLQQMIDINDAKNDNSAGFVTIEKNTSVGLYDYANGGGGPFDIYLEKDLEIPICYIGECLADSTVGSIQNYTLASVYGTNEAFWQYGKKEPQIFIPDMDKLANFDIFSWRSTSPNNRVLEHVYFNPDANSGFQFVYDIIQDTEVAKAIEESSNSKEFFDIINNCERKTELTDIDELPLFKEIYIKYCFEKNSSWYYGTNEETYQKLCKAFADKSSEVVIDKSVLKTDETFRYQLLGRMQTDCNYFLGNGDGHNKFLWGGNVETQIAYMRALYDSFPNEKKPEWISIENIDNYQKEMIEKETVKNA